MNSLEGVMIVGLTGQTGAGKTHVSSIFAQKGFSVINADSISRIVVEKGKPCLAEICEFFGEEILCEDGTLNRALLGKVVFSDKSRLELLNSIIYPYITAEILSTIRRLSDEGRKLILLDAPTLFESRTDDFCELIISVVSNEKIRLERIMKRDGISHENALQRMQSQLEEEFFKKNSDFIIKNNDDMSNIYEVTKEVADKIKDYYNNNYIK
ncbi:MAG: dephospho-CoA kinase [Oscillospiraceae bacterium]|nr:dephospho-CoA kinase [Oscillospiraceae bacterium]